MDGPSSGQGMSRSGHHHPPEVIAHRVRTNYRLQNPPGPKPQLNPGAKATLAGDELDLRLDDPLDGLQGFGRCPATLPRRRVVDVGLVTHEG